MSAIAPLHPLPPRRPTARVPLDRDGRFERAASWAVRRVYGKVLDPLKAAFHHRPVLLSMLALEGTASRWKTLSPTLQALAVMASAREIGCSWCMDFGYWEYHHQGVDPQKLRAISDWRSNEAYSPLERSVLEYAVAATATPSTVTDELVARLREDLSDAQVVELASLVSLENYRSRTNAGLGLTSQGFEGSCDVS
ncbi:carboxymuconolactone decarboxylase family protein [Brachybacterium sp. FME24]|uniref:carboxymuconolactone decarboxylase family protein n=1 Tax=Brachybacterium sp. FME24 TaxID=2742605 RepID=UPI001865F94A|nr:carboxymuconolactone decarboxylase family protein [Brachybacterium sp. FME24]